MTITISGVSTVIGKAFFITGGPSTGDIGVVAGGHKTTALNIIEYINIMTLSASIEFGELLAVRSSAPNMGFSNATNDRGVQAGGVDSNTNNRQSTMSFITITTPGNAQTFGTLSDTTTNGAATSNGINERGIIAFGHHGSFQNGIDVTTISGAGGASFLSELANGRAWDFTATSNGVSDRAIFAGGNVIDVAENKNNIYAMTISSTADAVFYSNLSSPRRSLSGVSNGVNDRAVFCGGIDTVAPGNILDYITISSSANAQTFGELLNIVQNHTSVSNGIDERAVSIGGQDDVGATDRMEYITISSGSDSVDFGDLSDIRQLLTGISNSAS